jgi:acyl-CoA synthetase (NDP forming)
MSRAETVDPAPGAARRPFHERVPPDHEGPIDADAIRTLAARLRSEGRSVLLEPEARAVLEAIGIPSPRQLFVHDELEARVADLDALTTERVVVKVVAPGLIHKTEVGGISVVRRDDAAVIEAVHSMASRLGALPIAGFSITEFVEHDDSIGGELLVSVRWTSDFGAIVSVGAGGVQAEAIAEDLRPGCEVAVVAPALTPREWIADLLGRASAVRLATTSLRGMAPRCRRDFLVETVARLSALADACLPGVLSEIEINPLVVTPRGVLALDALIRLGVGATPDIRPARPLHKLRNLLEPTSIGIIGVSQRENLGHIILGNLVRDGFDRRRIWVVKAGPEQIDGCVCVPDIASLPHKVDLFVVAVSAAQAPGIVAELIECDAAESVIIIPGGLGETRDSEPAAARIRQALDLARRTRDRGPLVNGGNCLGIRSRPGGYDTMFIPAAKLAPPAGRVAPLAVLAQSGGFAIARLSRIEGIEPKYVITVGNQLDLTVSDHLEYLMDDPDIGVFAVYVEGFVPLDGLRFLRLAREIAASGRAVILYRAGRTQAGARAAASHTASIAGDVVVTRELARQVGIVLADSLEAFDDLVRTFTLLHGRRPAGRRLGAISNAGFECVAIADEAGRLELPAFDEATSERIGSALAIAGIGQMVEVHNPLDLTPMADDALYEEAVRWVLGADTVDVGLVGIVPFTAALQTLAPGEGHNEDVAAPTSVASRLASAWTDSNKPWVVVLDAGSRYDPLAARIQQAGIPVFRTADAALRALDLYCSASLRD